MHSLQLRIGEKSTPTSTGGRRLCSRRMLRWETRNMNRRQREKEINKQLKGRLLYLGVLVVHQTAY